MSAEERTIAWYLEQLDTMPADTEFVPLDCQQCIIARIQQPRHPEFVFVEDDCMRIGRAIVPLTEDERYIIEEFDLYSTMNIDGARKFLESLLDEQEAAR